MWFKSPYPLAEILWSDATALEGGWLDPEEFQKEVKDEPYLVRSIGWIIRETEDAVIYCCDVGPKGETNGRSQIPKKMVKEIRYITTRKVSVVPPRRNRTSVTELQAPGPTTER